MKRWIKNSWKYICKEIVLKYLFCYILSAGTLLTSLFCNIAEPWNGWLISFSASIFSLPVIFVIYNLYVSALERSTQEKIAQKINNKVICVFFQFIYFSQSFFYKCEDSKPIGTSELKNCLSYSQNEIFTLIADNVFLGAVLFSEFDAFDENIEDIINEPIVCQYASQEDISILIDFIALYNKLMNMFSFIDADHYIECGKYNNVDIEESMYIKGIPNKKFYDVMWVLDDKSVQTFYTATYRIYQKEPLLNRYKVSGTKAQEIAVLIKEIYDCIGKWFSRHPGSSEIMPAGTIMLGRILFDCDVAYNQYMRNNEMFSE